MLKSRKAKLKKRVKVSLGKYVGMFRHDFRYNMRFIFASTKPGLFRIQKNQSILHTPSRCLHFSFSVEGFFKLNCLKGWLGKSIVD